MPNLLEYRPHLCDITEEEQAEGELLQILEPERRETSDGVQQAAHKAVRHGRGRPGCQAHMKEPNRKDVM